MAALTDQTLATGKRKCAIARVWVRPGAGKISINGREIEEYLMRHPRVADVQVFGVPDPKYGEEVCAWVIPRHGAALSEEDVREFCRGQIAHYKVPRHVRIVAEFPLTATGKPQKFEMRKATVQLLNLKEEHTA